MSKIEFKGENVVPLATWLKRFAITDSGPSGLLLEIDTQSTEFIAKTYSKDRSIVKMSRISFADLGLTTSNKPIEKRIMVGVYDISKIMKSLAQFLGEFTLNIKYSPAILLVDKVEEKSFAGLTFITKDDTLKSGFECASLSIFEYIADHKFANVISNLEGEDVISFDLKKEDRERILTLADLDKEYSKMSFEVVNQIVFARSKTFKLQIGITEHDDFAFALLKKQFSKIDIENYNTKMGSSRIVLESTDSHTITVIGKLDENQYDKDGYIDLD